MASVLRFLTPGKNPLFYGIGLVSTGFQCTHRHPTFQRIELVCPPTG